MNPNDVNFQLQKSFKVFDKTSADKIRFNKGKYIKLSSLMPKTGIKFISFKPECYSLTFLSLTFIILFYGHLLAYREAFLDFRGLDEPQFLI